MNTRYSRQKLFKPISEQGQMSLRKAIVTVIGCGALGSVIAETLARAGIGTLHLVDRDYVEFSNLQRQQLFTEQDAHNMVPKVVAAEKRLLEIRSDMKLHTYLENADNVLMEQLAAECHLIMDATDNFETRLLINDVSQKYGIPWIHGAVVGSTGSVFPFIPGKSACFRCLLPVLPAVNETCDTVGVIAPAVQITASLQCAEAMKWLTGNHSAMRTKFHHFDVWQNEQYDIGISRIQNENCLACGSAPTYPSLQENHRMETAVLCGRDAVQILPNKFRTVSLEDAELVAAKFKTSMKRTPYFVQFYAFDYRMILFKNGRLLIHGLKDIKKGRTLYHQLFG